MINFFKDKNKDKKAAVEDSATLATINIDITNLNPAQVRLIRSLNAMIQHVLKVEHEDEFFEGSAEILRMTASLIKQANFTQLDHANDIPYAKQALEYSIETLCAQMGLEKIITYDN